jgi:ABC-type transport system involved in multi-copper enzyme maturation permease subunit
MFATLFLKECKHMLKCSTYSVVIICMALFFFSQWGELKIVDKPEPNQEYYGVKFSEDEKVVMQQAASSLALEYVQNNYIAYPVGFYKTVKLNESKQSKMGNVVTEVTGLTEEELIETVDIYLSGVTAYADPLSISVAQELTYERFEELMKQADKLIGGGSTYSETFLLTKAMIEMTYEDALEEYYDVIDKEQLSGAYARLFSDYLGLVLAILPVFIAVTRGLRDRRARASEIIYSRRVSSFTIVISRYLAMLLMMLIPVMLLSLVPAIECLYYGMSQGISIDYFAYVKYIFGWLLPTIMISLSVGVFLTELMDSAIAIVVQGFWWFISLFLGVTKMMGGYGWNLMPRHNTLGNYETFQENFDILVANRITYAFAAILLALATIFVYEMRRKGKLRIHGTIFSNRKSKSKV